jgi:ribosomal protein L32
MSIYGIGQPTMYNAYYYDRQANNYSLPSRTGQEKPGDLQTAHAAGVSRGAAGSGTAAARPQTAAELQALKKMGAVECQTCKSRAYQDGSNDPGVSFKTPGHIDPGSSAAAVRSHEQEHVVNEQAKARSDGKRVISQSVSISMSVCPECGRAYASGGVTRTVTASGGNKSSAIAQYSKSKSPSAGRRINSVV